MGVCWVTTPTVLVYLAIWNVCLLSNPPTDPADRCWWRIAGRAAASAFTGCAVTIQSTYSRAEEVSHAFAHTGSVSAGDGYLRWGFDLINATSSGINGDVPAIPCIWSTPTCIAMTCSIRKEKPLFFTGASSGLNPRNADGLQECWWDKAPMPFCFWHGVLPDGRTGDLKSCSRN